MAVVCGGLSGWVGIVSIVREHLMLIGCCHCGEQSESSQSASGSAGASASASDGGSASASASSASESVSSDSTPPYGECVHCNAGISPSVYEFTWTLANNCPWSPDTGQPEVGCYDNFSFPVQLQRDFFTWSPGGGGVIPPSNSCLWRSTSIGGVSVDGEGQCSPWPAIQLAIGQDDLGNYRVLLQILWAGPYTPTDPPLPITVSGFLVYEKVFSELPPNCLASMDLDWLIAGGNYDLPGFPNGVAYGPGCNAAYGDPFTGASSFPGIVTIAPLL